MSLFRPLNDRKRGNALRKAGKWPEAVVAFRKHLDGHPDDRFIWLQYGHGLKALGRLAEAETAYRAAARLMPDDSDIHYQLGHVLKLQDRHAESLVEYRRAMALGQSDGIEVEIRNANARMSHVPVALSAGTTLYSVQDMLWYLNVHTTFSGIQRVQAGIATYLLDQDAADVDFVMTDAVPGLEQGDFWRLDRNDLRAVIAYASGQDIDHAHLRRLISQCETNATPVRAGAGTTVIVLGAFWGLGNTPESFLPAKRAGARIGVYVYDIIPLSHPDYCEAELSLYFSMAMGQICAFADFILTISDYTRVTLKALLDDLGVRDIPMATVPLAHLMTGAVERVQDRPAALNGLQGRDFVAYVSTVEGRKNHIYVVRVWQQLIAAGIAVPDLVFVGRKGWRVAELTALLAQTDNLGGRVHIVHDLTDRELNAVYTQSRFTVFTSLVEGWGLPVGESLIHGTPCVASNVSSMPEVGGSFVDYIDPLDIKDGVRVMGRMIADTAYLDQRRRDIAENFKPRGWADVGADFVAKVEHFSRVAPVVVHPSRLAEGRIMRPGDQLAGATDLADSIRNPRGLLLSGSFYAPEPFGAWMRGTQGEIRFLTGLPVGSPVVVYLALVKAADTQGSGVSVGVGGQRMTVPWGAVSGLDGSPTVLRARGRTEAGGLCHVTIDVAGEAPERAGDPRRFMVGLTAFGFADADSVSSRMDLLESYLLDGAR